MSFFLVGFASPPFLDWVRLKRLPEQTPGEYEAYGYNLCLGMENFVVTISSLVN